MLTDKDLKQIRNIVSEVVIELLKPIEERLDKVEKRIEGLDMDISEMREVMTSMNRRLELIEMRMDNNLKNYDTLASKVVHAGKVLSN